MRQRVSIMLVVASALSGACVAAGQAEQAESRMLDESVLVNGIRYVQGCVLDRGTTAKEAAKAVLLSHLAERIEKSVGGRERSDDRYSIVAIQTSATLLPPQIISYRQIIAGTKKYTCALAKSS